MAIKTNNKYQLPPQVQDEIAKINWLIDHSRISTTTIRKESRVIAR